MADVLAFAELKDGRIGSAARESVGVAARLAGDSDGAAHALVLTAPDAGVAGSELGEFGAGKVLVGEHPELAEYHPEGYAPVVAARIREGGYGAVVFSATTLGKDLAPRVAALLDVPLASDVTEVSTENGTISVVRPVYSGKAFARLHLETSPALLSIRPNVFQPEAPAAAGEVETFSAAVDPSTWRVRVIERRSGGEGTLDVAEASIIVSGGRGMKGPEHWHVLEKLRDAIGAEAALGASRAVVDAGWRPHGEQVGQTGKTVAPQLYFAVGISGAIQHLAGMRTSKTIVAINKDPDAPIFGVADYGIIGDLFEVVPKLAEETAALRSER